MGLVAKLKRTWNLAPVFRIVQKITENYCPWLYLPTGQVWWLHDLWFKRYSYQKMHLISCPNTHRDITDLGNHGMVKNRKTWISWERNIIFLQNKKVINLGFRWHILRSYRFGSGGNLLFVFFYIREKKLFLKIKDYSKPICKILSNYLFIKVI